jgi:hypothetical protein
MASREESAGESSDEDDHESPDEQSGDSESEDDSDEEGSQEQPSRAASPQAYPAPARADALAEIMTIFHPDFLSVDEFTQSMRNSNQAGAQRLTSELVRVLLALTQTDPALHSLGFLRGQRYFEQLAENMENRFRVIIGGLEQNIWDSSAGQNVPDTISRLRQLYLALDSVRQRYFDSASIPSATRRRISSLLVAMLLYVLRSNHDLYERGPQLASAGEAFRPTRRMVSCLMAEDSSRQIIIGVLNRFNGHLSHEAARLQNAVEVVRAHQTHWRASDSDTRRYEALDAFRVSLQTIANSMTCPL